MSVTHGLWLDAFSPFRHVTNRDPSAVEPCIAEPDGALPGFLHGLLREDGSPKPAAERFRAYTPHLGICQWLHFGDYRLEDAARWMRDLGVRYLRSGLSWADGLRPGAEQWFDRMMRVLEPFFVDRDLLLHSGRPGNCAHRTSPPIPVHAWYAVMHDNQECYASAGMIAALGRGDRAAVSPLVIVAAHPDDEVVSAGGVLLRFGGDISIIHVTDGSPRNLADASAAGFSSRREYADARQRDLYAALSLAGIGPDRCFSLDIPDQEAVVFLAGTAERIATLLESLAPRLVLTHPYEGGHPDHDSAAFAVHAAVRMLPRERIRPIIAEFSSYYARGSEMARLEFIPATGCFECMVELSLWECERKERMVRCFETQRATISSFPINLERYRSAPVCDFTAPPHPGPLFYEYFDWGMTGERWRALARVALKTLGVGERL